MAVITNIPGIKTAGAVRKLPSERAFYLNKLMDSPFHARISTLADKVERMIVEKGNGTRFNRELFYEAAGLCIHAHEGQTRKISGLPFADHPISVTEREATILRVTDQNELIACLLHDTVEDGSVPLGAIRRRFGAETARLVDGMTKIKQLEQDRLISEENIDKFLIALSSDIRVLRMKMTDRGCNLEDAEKLPSESRERNCGEALNLYVPLGVLSGLMKASRHLADVAFRQLKPDRHSEIKGIIHGMVAANKPLLDGIKGKITAGFRGSFKDGIPKALLSDPYARRFIAERAAGLKILTKPRTVYEIDQIATLRKTDARSFSDIVMMQLIVPCERDCYTMVDIVHSLGKPVNRHWRDYIKDPKINGYRSIHTAVMLNDTVVRFQIRTEEMQKLAEDGLIHRSYGSNGVFRQPRLPWLNSRWLSLILRSTDRREKILLIKSLAESKLAAVTVASDTVCATYDDILLPKNISPLDAAFITDPAIGFHLASARHRETDHGINTSIDGHVGQIMFEIAADPIEREYDGLLRNPLAYFRYKEYLSRKKKAT